MKRRGILELTGATVLLLISAYGALWIVSSSHLAHDACAGSFSLFHEHLRCRQPYLALILAVVAGIPALLLFVLGIRHVLESGT